MATTYLPLVSSYQMEATMDEIKNPHQEESPASKEPKAAPQELTEAELAQAAGGNVTVHDISITKTVDKSSPTLFTSEK